MSNCPCLPISRCLIVQVSNCPVSNCPVSNCPVSNCPGFYTVCPSHCLLLVYRGWAGGGGGLGFGTMVRMSACKQKVDGVFVVLNPLADS